MCRVRCPVLQVIMRNGRLPVLTRQRAWHVCLLGRVTTRWYHQIYEMRSVLVLSAIFHRLPGKKLADVLNTSERWASIWYGQCFANTFTFSRESGARMSRNNGQSVALRAPGRKGQSVHPSDFGCLPATVRVVARSKI